MAEKKIAASTNSENASSLKATEGSAEQAELHRVRDLILGSSISDLQRDIERITADLRQLQDAIGDLDKSQAKRIEALERQTRQTDDELKQELDRLRSQYEGLAKTVQESAVESRKAIDHQEQELETLGTTFRDNREQLERKVEALKRESRQADDDLMIELRRIADRLDNQKIDRKTLAGMLMDVASRLETEESLPGLLEGLTSSAQE